jgi:uncharacterized protein YbjT (DUF2867 family)
VSYAVIGATGNTGKQVAEGLLEQGKDVRAIARKAARLEPLADKGAKIHEGSIMDSAFLTRAFNGVSAVYAMIPPDVFVPDARAGYGRFGDAIVTALKAAEVKYVVSLSAQGANLPEKTGPIAGLFDQEQRLNRLTDVNVVHLRATFFMENLLQNIPAIKAEGIISTPLRSDLPLAMISARDIGDAAVHHLRALDFEGHVVHDLLGPRDFTMSETTRVLGNAIGKPELKYVQTPYAQAAQAMIAAGFSKGMARSFVELYRAYNDGLIAMPARTTENTTHTTMEEFGAVFGAAFRGSPWE